MNAGLPMGTEGHQEYSLYKEDINTSYLLETQTDGCRAGIMHRAKGHDSNFPLGTSLLLFLKYVYPSYDPQYIQSCPQGVCLVKQTFSEEG